VNRVGGSGFTSKIERTQRWEPGIKNIKITEESKEKRMSTSTNQSKDEKTSLNEDLKAALSQISPEEEKKIEQELKELLRPKGE